MMKQENGHNMKKYISLKKCKNVGKKKTLIKGQVIHKNA